MLLAYGFWQKDSPKRFYASGLCGSRLLTLRNCDGAKVRRNLEPSKYFRNYFYNHSAQFIHAAEDRMDFWRIYLNC